MFIYTTYFKISSFVHKLNTNNHRNILMSCW